MSKYIRKVNLNNNVNQDWENLKSVTHIIAIKSLGKKRN